MVFCLFMVSQDPTKVVLGFIGIKSKSSITIVKIILDVSNDYFL